MMLTAGLLFILAGQDFATSEWCDVIEFNHRYDANGKLSLEQYIFWEWEAEMSEYRVREWRLLTKDMALTHMDNGAMLRWRDGSYGLDRRVCSRHFKETWTQFDPEVEDRRVLNENSRRRFASKTQRNIVPPSVTPEVEQ